MVPKMMSKLPYRAIMSELLRIGVGETEPPAPAPPQAWFTRIGESRGEVGCAIGVAYPDGGSDPGLLQSPKPGGPTASGGGTYEKSPNGLSSPSSPAST